MSQHCQAAFGFEDRLKKEDRVTAHESMSAQGPKRGTKSPVSRKGATGLDCVARALDDTPGLGCPFSGVYSQQAWNRKVGSSPSKKKSLFVGVNFSKGTAPAGDAL